MAGGSPPADIDICESPDTLQTEWSATYTEMAGGSPPADRDNCESPELLQRAGFVTAVVSEKHSSWKQTNTLPDRRQTGPSTFLKLLSARIPLFVIESDTVQVSGLQLVESDAAQVLSCLLPVGSSRPFFWGRSPLI